MKKGLAVAMAALLGVATMGTTVMAAASGDITICSREDGSGTRGALNCLELKKKTQMEIK